MKQEKGRRIVVRRSSIHGKGVFALRRIPKRTIVIEYAGKRISHKEADRLFGEEQENSPHTMLFTVNDKIVIDATRNGNSA
ncbi:MAG: SET domain-containing protein-lysine N-methyltransferase, partial [Deltaproteobacteria bacterium]|nr:SET domain-containing protein-lysine N-methyltransferase [Deltaproteobacteria bacterium]